MKYITDWVKGNFSHFFKHCAQAHINIKSIYIL